MLCRRACLALYCPTMPLRRRRTRTRARARLTPAGPRHRQLTCRWASRKRLPCRPRFGLGSLEVGERSALLPCHGRGQPALCVRDAAGPDKEDGRHENHKTRKQGRAHGQREVMRQPHRQPSAASSIGSTVSHLGAGIQRARLLAGCVHLQPVAFAHTSAVVIAQCSTPQSNVLYQISPRCISQHLNAVQPAAIPSSEIVRE